MAGAQRNVLSEIAANRPSCVDQERASLGKPIFFFFRILKTLLSWGRNDLGEIQGGETTWGELARGRNDLHS